MDHQPATEAHHKILATDLDGTLIPLHGDPQNQADLETLAGQLAENRVTLIYITGRHLAYAAEAIEEFCLPAPDWLICDVGTSIYERKEQEFCPVEDYQQHQDRIIAALPIRELQQRLQSFAGLRLQEAEKQGRFKLSFYADATELDDLVGRIRQELGRTDAPYSVIDSVDPFNGDGLVDFVPADVSKAHALAWWVEHAGLDPERIVFAGDSGNDLAALVAGYRAIVVGNADRRLARQAYEAHRESGWRNRLYLARGTATSGVLEGCRWFGLARRVPATIERLGATPVGHNQTHFRVWAPRSHSVEVELGRGKTKRRGALAREEFGYFTGVVDAGSSTRYRYVLDGRQPRPDPVSVYQPQGVHGASQIVDPQAFAWTDQDWQGVPKRELVIYELHVGAFTEQGTFPAAAARLDELAELGVTAVELMPVAQTPGRWNWGYDGVYPFAVRNTYGEPDDFKAFVDACHAHGLAVILDVVYNHLGPEGNYLAEFGPYFSRKHHTPWGDAFNFDGRHARHVRRYVVDNAVRWLDEYHLDGLRLDAVHFMLDDSRPTILDEIRQAVSEFAATANRAVHLIAEANVYSRELLGAAGGEAAYDAIWCDCLMHSIYSHALPELRLTHRHYLGAADLALVLQYGYVYAGRESRRVSAAERDQLHAGDSRAHLASFVTALQTHDCVGNHPHGKRLHQLTSKEFQKAAAAVALLFPSIPLVFMGEEYAAEAPFPFFADFEDDRLRQAVDRGRAHEYPQHVWRDALPPSHPDAFYAARCTGAANGDAEMFAWYRELLALRKRGLAEGWLSTEGLAAEFDAEQDLVSLRFEHPREGAVVVQARLTPPGRPDVEPVGVEVDGQIVLSSASGPNAAAGHVLLGANGVVVCAPKTRA